MTKKIEELVKSMTLEQKIAQLQCELSFGTKVTAEQYPHGLGEVGLLAGASKNELKEVILASSKELAEKANGIRPIFHIETLTGASLREADVFPSAIGFGASFDPEMVEKCVEIIRDQTLAVGYKQSLSPVLDVCRDPRWGRVGETYGEDPTLNAMIGTAYVKTLQGKEGDNRLSATGKHFLGYGFSSGGINMATCMASDRELREVYAKPFQAAITEADLMSIMNSYGTIDGEMVISSKKIMTDLLRDEMEFEGMVVSDYASIEHLLDHRLVSDLAEGGREALIAGLDIECPKPVGFKTEDLMNAVKSGELDEKYIDRAVLRILKVKEKLGLIAENDNDTKEINIDTVFYNEKNRKQSLGAGHKSIVMLKNDGVLPLEKEKQKIAVIGPHADNKRLLFGCYTFAAGTDMMIGGSLADQAGMESSVDDLSKGMDIQEDVPKYEGSTVEKSNEGALKAVEALYPFTNTFLKSLKEKNPAAEVSYVKGCEVAGTDRSEFQQAISLAEDADVVFMALGGKYGWGGSCTIGEGIDADDIGLSGVQEELALKIIETGKPVVIVHMDARPLSSVALEEKASAILECWFQGTIGGDAIADVIYGDYNPAGRLPITVPKNTGQIPVYASQYVGNSYYSEEAPTVSARYVDSTPRPLYYFGYGLSYTEFSYSDLTIKEDKVPANGEVKISCKVKNIGKCDGEEVVQLYVSDLKASMLRPYKEFAGCKRLALKAGEEKTVEFTFRADQFAFIGKDDKWIVEEGDMQVMIGGSSENLELTGNFYITNTAEVRPAHRGFYAKTTVK